MSDNNRRTAFVIGAIAAAAGIAVASAILIRNRRAQAAAPTLRSVSEVLSDCYARMRDIQSHLSELTTAPPARHPVTQ